MRTNDIRHAAELIRRGFSWKDTEEGTAYWATVYAKLFKLSGCHVENGVVYVYPSTRDTLRKVDDPKDDKYKGIQIFEIRKYDNEM